MVLTSRAPPLPSSGLLCGPAARTEQRKPCPLAGKSLLRKKGSPHGVLPTAIGAVPFATVQKLPCRVVVAAVLLSME